MGFLLVVARVEDGEIVDALLAQQLGEHFGFSIEVVPTSTGWPRAAGLGDQVGDGVELLGGGAEDRIILVDALDRRRWWGW